MNIFRSLTIRHKVFLLAILGGFLALAISVGSIYAISAVGQKLKQIAKEDIPLTNAVTNITVHQLEQAIMFEQAIRFAAMKNNGRDSDSQKKYREVKNEFFTLAKKVDQEIIDAEQMAIEIIEYETSHGGEQAIIDEFLHVKDILSKIKKAHSDFDDHVAEVFTLFETGQFAKAERKALDVEAEEKELDHQLEALLAELGQFTADATDRAAALEVKLQKILTISSVTGTLFFMVLAFFIVI